MIRQVFKNIKYETSLSIINRSGKLLIANLLGIPILFISNFYFIRLLGERMYGELVTVNVWLSVLTVIVLFGMDDLFIMVLPKEMSYYSAGTLAPAMLRWSFRICFFIFLLLVLLSSLVLRHSSLYIWFRQQSAGIIFYFLMLAIFALLNAFFRGVNIILLGQFLDKVLRSSIVVGVLSFFYFTGRSLTFNQSLYIQAIALLICILLFVREFNRKFDLPFSEKVHFNKSIKPNLSFLGISLLNFLAARLDILMLTAFSTPEQVGYYNVAARISDLLSFPSMALYLILPTFLSREWVSNRENAIKTLRTIVIISLAVVLSGLVLLLLFGRHILGYFGENFAHSYWVMIFLSTVNIFSIFSLPVNTIMMVDNKQRFSLVALAAYVLLILVISFFLVPMFGAIGAAIAMLSGSFFYLAVIHFIGSRLFAKDLSFIKFRINK